MRKSVIFAISVIYILSIVVVTFFGIQVRTDQFKVYYTQLEITSYDQVVDGTKWLRVNFNDDEGYVSEFITFNSAPNNVTDKFAIKFSLGNVPKYIDESTGEEKDCAEIKQTGELVFFKRCNVIAYVSTTDGSSLSDSVLVRCK